LESREALQSQLAQFEEAAATLRERDEQLDAAHRTFNRMQFDDPLTGLPNIRALREAFEGAAGDGPNAMVLIAIDGFERFNANHGYH
ncbi:GGDEF domain-containing protein, partial [Pseudomonas sp. FW306-2-2C-B10A]